MVYSLEKKPIKIVNVTTGITQSVTQMMDFELINIWNAKKIKNPV